MDSVEQHDRGGSFVPENIIDLRTLSALLDHAHDAILIRRLDGEILYWSKGAERLYGWTAGEATGRDSASLLRPLLPAPLVVIEESLRRDGQWEGSIAHTHRDGRAISLHSRWALDTSGPVPVVLEINRDITARLEAQEAARARERQLRFVTDSAPVLIAHCDAAGRFRFVNKPYAARFGLHPSELVGRRIADVLGERAHDTIKPYIGRALRGERVDVELEVPYEKLGRQVMHFAYEPEVNDAGEVVGFVAAIVNVSDRHRAEEALREADRRKDAFLAMLAHELRNPLAAMRNATHLLSTRGADAATTRRAGTIIDRQLKQLARIVDDLLDVSRITRGQLTLRTARVRLADVVATALEATAFATAAASQNLAVSLPDQPVFLDADAERLSQVLTNLLTNATKYTPPGGRISLSATATRDGVTIVVSDTGAGIPQDMLEDVFGMFTQVDSSRDQGHGGLGIGLTLVRWLVELHGGTVKAESEGPNKGSRFTIRLPRPADGPEPPAEEDERRPPATSPPRRVLVADDNLDAAESLQMWLQMSGHDVEIAQDGPAALAVAESFRPEVVLLDLGMPGMTGLEVARRIRAAEWGRGMILMALTGWGQEEDRQRTAEAGFDHHLTKPIDPERIDALIRGA